VNEPTDSIPRWRRIAIWIVLFAAPLLVFHPITFGGFTFSLSPFAMDPSVKYGDSDTLPVLDPAAASSQDEAWLILIRRSLLEGKLPVVNMRNGLGAPLLETLQPGVLYPPNLLLPLLPGNSPWMFDLFLLLHIEVLVGGLFVLFCLYARREVALVVALTVGVCGATYQHVDMVHFRSYVWLPWALAAAVRIARGRGRTLDTVVFLAARIASITSGALQDAFVTTLAVAAVFLVELWSARAETAERLRRLGHLALLGVASALVAAPSVMPYLAARANGDLFTQATPERSILGLDGDGLLAVLLPHAHGVWPHLLRPDRGIRWMSNFATVGAFFLVLALVVVAFRRGAPERRKFVAFAVLTTLATLKVQHLSVFDWIEHVPFINEILFVKYHHALYVLFGIVAAMGLEALMQCEPRVRRRLVFRAAAVFALISGAALFYVVQSSAWLPLSALPEGTRAEVLTAHAGSIGALLAAIVLLAWPGRHGLLLLALAVIAQGMLVAPRGWAKRLPEYWIPDDAESLVVKGLPERVMTRLPPNQNIMQDIESISVFDPVHLRSVHEFYSRNFRIENAGFSLHPIGGVGGLTQRELNAARLLGVQAIHGFSLEARGVGPWRTRRIITLNDTLPRVFLLTREAAQRIQAESKAQALHETLRELRTAIAETPEARLTRVGSRVVDFEVDGDFQGVAVVSQAYAHGWTLDGRVAEPFLSILCAWDVDVRAGQRVSVWYWPPGLDRALWLSAVGCVMALGALGLAWRRDRSAAPIDRVSAD
jgi:hypothetical protein